MKISLTLKDGRRLAAKLPYDGADHVFVDAVDKCPACGEGDGVDPFRVRGQGNHVEQRDTYAAEARALCCGAVVGTIRAKVSTIFGIDEDAEVLSGKYGRVY